MVELRVGRKGSPICGISGEGLQQDEFIRLAGRWDYAREENWIPPEDKGNRHAKLTIFIRHPHLVT